jgi:hypothetical protein
MLGLAHDEAAGNFVAQHPSIHSAFTAAKTFRENSQAFVNLSIYEQRITRHQKEALRQLKDLQNEREAQARQALEEAVLLRKAHQLNNLPFDAGLHKSAHGFVYSTAEIDREIHRRDLLATLPKPQPAPRRQAA